MNLIELKSTHMGDLLISIGILCGGRSRRFGSDKYFHNINGQTIVELVYDKFKELTDDIFLQLSNNNKARTKMFNFNAKVNYDTVQNKGPLGGIYSVLKHAKYERTFVIAGDLPFVDRNILFELQSHAKFQLVVPKWDNDFVEPLCAIYSKALLPLIKTQMETGDFKISNLYNVIERNYGEIMNIKYININELIQCKKISNGCFKNINYLEDLGH